MSQKEHELSVLQRNSSPSNENDNQSSITEKDDIALRRLGKRPLLNRSFGFMSILGLSCSAMCSWEGILITSVPALMLGGPAQVTWSFFINWFCIASVTAVMAELASIAPTAGGQYHWIAMLAPKKYVGFLTYVTAWLTTLAWQAIAIATTYNTTTILQGIIALSRPGYEPQAWHTLLIMYAHTVFAVVLNVSTGRTLARFEGLILILHLAGFLGVLVPMVYYAPHNPASFVFTEFYNNAGWATNAMAFFVGMPSVASALIGADCAVHMSEEIQSAPVVVPRAMMWTILINGSLAFAMIIGLQFCIQDLEAVMESSTRGIYPFLVVFETSVKSVNGACVMAGIMWVVALAACVSVYASCSRMMWSFARDRGLPLDKHLVKLARDSLPVNAILATTIISSVLSLIALGSAVALSAILSLLVSSLFSSYLIVCILLLWRRLTGGISTQGSGSDVIDTDTLEWGPWKLPEPFGTANNVFALIYCIILLFWSFWPSAPNPTAETFNWAVLVFGSVMLFSVVWYFIRARHFFKGPIKDV